MSAEPGERRSFHVSFAGLAELEVGDRAKLRVVHVVEQGAVDPDLLRPRVDAERIAVPQHDVGALAGAQAAGLLGDAERRAGLIASQRQATSSGISIPMRRPSASALAASWLSRWMPLASSEWTIAQAPALWTSGMFSLTAS